MTRPQTSSYQCTSCCCCCCSLTSNHLKIVSLLLPLQSSHHLLRVVSLSLSLSRFQRLFVAVLFILVFILALSISARLPFHLGSTFNMIHVPVVLINAKREGGKRVRVKEGEGERENIYKEILDRRHRFLSGLIPFLIC